MKCYILAVMAVFVVFIVSDASAQDAISAPSDVPGYVPLPFDDAGPEDGQSDAGIQRDAMHLNALYRLIEQLRAEGADQALLSDLATCEEALAATAGLPDRSERLRAIEQEIHRAHAGYRVRAQLRPPPERPAPGRSSHEQASGVPSYGSQDIGPEGSATSPEGLLLFRETYSAYAFACDEHWPRCTNELLLEANGRGINYVVLSVYERRVVVERYGPDGVQRDDWGRVREIEGDGWHGFTLAGGRFLQITDGEAFLFSEPVATTGGTVHNVMEALYSPVP